MKLLCQKKCGSELKHLGCLMSFFIISVKFKSFENMKKLLNKISG